MTPRTRPPAFRANVQVACRSFPHPATGERVRVSFDLPAIRGRIEHVLSLSCDFPSSVNVRVCDAEEMRAANASWRGKDYATDVLSFPSAPGTSDTALRGKQLFALGDLLVCLPVCAAQARTHKVTLAAEIERMVVHGLVHLKGFDHEKSDPAWRVMTALEKALARALHETLGPPAFAAATTA